jgi:hypothetical protein
MVSMSKENLLPHSHLCHHIFKIPIITIIKKKTIIKIWNKMLIFFQNVNEISKILFFWF